jgi:hypothetical protein
MRELTREELRRSETGPSFANVRPADLFGTSSSFELASRVRRENPLRYRELRQEWDYICGKPRPSDHFNEVKQ